jgi:peptidoglycan/LPS O-acetylase OafA/YrhL
MQYAISRCARIYSVVLPALIITFVLDAVGRAAKPSLYTPEWGYVWTGRLSQFLHAITFTNQIWFNKIPPGSDLPFWSLGFEIWYYVVFGLAMFTSKHRRVALMVLALLVMGPKIDALLPIWLMGVAAYHVCAKRVISLALGWMMCIGSIIAWGAYEFLAWHFGRPVAANWLGRAHIIQDYIVGTLFTLHLIGFRRISHVPAEILTKFSAPIRWVAGSTLTLYLLHLPLLQIFAAESPWPVTAWQTRSMELLGILPAILIIAQFTERRKNIWRAAFRVAFTRIARRSA